MNGVMEINACIFLRALLWLKILINFENAFFFLLGIFGGCPKPQQNTLLVSLADVLLPLIVLNMKQRNITRIKRLIGLYLCK